MSRLFNVSIKNLHVYKNNDLFEFLISQNVIQGLYKFSILLYFDYISKYSYWKLFS